MAKRGVLPQVLAAVQGMEAEILAAEARGLTPDQQAAAAAARASLARAEVLGSGLQVPGRFPWWRGTQVESSYLHLHVARVAMVDLYDEDELKAEIPRAVARVQGALHRDDPRRLGHEDLAEKDPRALRATLRRLVEDGHEATDLQHRRLRSFRNVTLLAALAVILAVVVATLVVFRDPDLLPLCFTDEDAGTTACPSSNDSDGVGTADGVGPSSWDIVMVALMGLLGGLLSAVFSLRHLRGLSTAYEAPVALAVLKPPLGALTGVTGIVLVHGQFIPGLSTLDSQGQILAYSFLFGVGQQVFTRLVDQKAESIMEGMPSRDPTSSPGEPVKPTPHGPLPPAPPPGGDGVLPPPGAEGSVVVVGEPGAFDTVPAGATTPPPPGVADDGHLAADVGVDVGVDVEQPTSQPEAATPEQPAEPRQLEQVVASVPSGARPDHTQDDGSPVDGDAPERDHT